MVTFFCRFTATCTAIFIKQLVASTLSFVTNTATVVPVEAEVLAARHRLTQAITRGMISDCHKTLNANAFSFGCGTSVRVAPSNAAMQLEMQMRAVISFKLHNYRARLTAYSDPCN